MPAKRHYFASQKDSSPERVGGCFSITLELLDYLFTKPQFLFTMTVESDIRQLSSPRPHHCSLRPSARVLVVGSQRRRFDPGFTDAACRDGSKASERALPMPTNILITVDTEFCPKTRHLRGWDPEEDWRRDVYGSTAQGDFGVVYQMDMLDAYGLKAVFFVEALFACAFGHERLCEIVELIQGRGFEVQLHLHTEWLGRMSESILPGRTGKYLKDFSEKEQGFLVGRALENIRAAGARNVCAFRAGNYGADVDTLRALRHNGILYDTSYDYPLLGSKCGILTSEPVLQPRLLEGVIEVPITFFLDRPGHHRHLQLTACSHGEIRAALLQAWSRGWCTAVLVSHSFELVGRRVPGRVVRPDFVVIRRFERLCRFLAQNRDKFRTTTFSELGQVPLSDATPGGALRSNPFRTICRMAEQVWRGLPFRWPGSHRTMAHPHSPLDAQKPAGMGGGEGGPAGSQTTDRHWF